MVLPNYVPKLQNIILCVKINKKVYFQLLNRISLLIPCFRVPCFCYIICFEMAARVIILNYGVLRICPIPIRADPFNRLTYKKLLMVLNFVAYLTIHNYLMSLSLISHLPFQRDNEKIVIVGIRE